MVNLTISNQETLKPNNKNYKKLLLPFTLGTIGAIGGYSIPFYKTVECNDSFKPSDYTYYPQEKTPEMIRARIKQKKLLENNGSLLLKKKKIVLAKLLRKEPNYPLKILFAIIGGVLGYFAGKKLNQYNNNKNGKT
mgnify:CR=1 FL=1